TLSTGGAVRAFRTVSKTQRRASSNVNAGTGLFYYLAYHLSRRSRFLVGRATRSRRLPAADRAPGRRIAGGGQPTRRGFARRAVAAILRGTSRARRHGRQRRRPHRVGIRGMPAVRWRERSGTEGRERLLRTCRAAGAQARHLDRRRARIEPFRRGGLLGPEDIRGEMV